MVDVIDNRKSMQIHSDKGFEDKINDEKFPKASMNLPIQQVRRTIHLSPKSKKEPLSTDYLDSSYTVIRETRC